MFGQPRCREWTPLATQQLRLRSLIQIVGYNILEDDGGTQTGSLYYTLHTTTMSAPFYTSEKLLSNHPKWREIDSELIQKMSSSSVVVRIWRHTRHDNNPFAPSDTMVQTWGVNFNGLLHIGANLALDFSPKSFKNNTLVFQMMGGYFCSYNSLKLEPAMKVLPNIEQSKKEAVLGKEASPSRKIPIDKNTRLASESKSLSPGKGWKLEAFESRGVAKSSSPPVGCFRQSYGSYKSSNSNLSHSSRQDVYRNIQDGRERKRSDSYNSSIYEHSPKSDNDVEIKEYLGSDESSDALKSCGSLSTSSRELHKIEVEESEQAENFDANIPPVPKCRYSSMNFLKSEVRPSYTAEKLRKLHHLQYMIKKRTDTVQEIKERIYKKSAIENCEDLSSHEALIDNEDFSRSERLCMSQREFILRNKSSSRGFGKLLTDSNLSLQASEKDLSKLHYDATQENREEKSASLPPDKDLDNIRRDNLSINKYLEKNLIQSDRRFTPLSKLLELKSQPSPSQRLLHMQLTRQAELSRFKRRLLQDERDAALAKLRRLRQQKIRIFEENQDNSTELMQNYHSLSRKAEQLRELKKSEAALKELYHRSCSLLLARRWKLVQDLFLIYPITENESGVYQILNISLPACRDNSDGLRQCGEADLAVALGRVAHVTALAASLLGAPLRHPLRLMGSRTKVLDNVVQDNEIPLFARNKDSMMFRYGLFLLNRDIAQLLWATHRVITPDPRDTLANVKRLLTPPTVSTGLDASRLFGSGSSMETTGTSTALVGMVHPITSSPLLNTAVTPPKGMSLTSVHSHQSIRTMIPKHHHHRPFNRFKDSIDGTSPKAAMLLRKHRYSRSVGSYADDHNLTAMEMDSSVVGSEPSLLLVDSPVDVHASMESKPLSYSQENKLHTLTSFSESDLRKVTDVLSPGSSLSSNDFCNAKVIFCIGEETPGSGSKKSPKKQMLKSRSFESDGILTNSQLQELKCDVNRLSKEIQILNNDCDKDSCNNACKSNETGERHIRKCGTICEDSPIQFLNFSDLSEVSKVDADSSSFVHLQNDCSDIEEDREFLLNVESFEAYETETDEDVATISNIILVSKNKVDKEVSTPDQTDSGKAIVNTPFAVDIEQLDYPPFCTQPCNVKCPRPKEECPKVLKTGYDQCKDGQEIMQDVKILPSAEAVMTTSSHFTDSPLFDSKNRDPTDLEVVEEFSQMNGDDIVNLAKRVLKFEDDEKSKSILAVLKGSSVDNDAYKTDNDSISKSNIKITSNSNSGRIKDGVNCFSSDQICDNSDCRNVDKSVVYIVGDRSCQNATQDGGNRVCDCKSNLKSDTSDVSISRISNDGKIIPQGKNGDGLGSLETSLDAKNKCELNGYR